MGERLTEAQRSVLACLVLWDWRRDGCLSGPDISRIIRRGFDDWARNKLAALEKRGLVERVGSTFSGTTTWRETDAGRAALDQPAGQGERS